MKNNAIVGCTRIVRLDAVTLRQYKAPQRTRAANAVARLPFRWKKINKNDKIKNQSINELNGWLCAVWCVHPVYFALCTRRVTFSHGGHMGTEWKPQTLRNVRTSECIAKSLRWHFSLHVFPFRPLEMVGCAAAATIAYNGRWQPNKLYSWPTMYIYNGKVFDELHLKCEHWALSAIALHLHIEIGLHLGAGAARTQTAHHSPCT